MDKYIPKSMVSVLFSQRPPGTHAGGFGSLEGGRVGTVGSRGVSARGRYG